MTVTEIARRLNVSTMTIYRRMKRAGLSLEELRDENGELTPAGASVISSLFDGPQRATDGATSDATEHNEVVQQVATGPDVTSVAILQTELKAAREKIVMLEGERDRLLNQLDAAMAALAAEQRDRANERLLLTGGQERRRGGLLSWFRRDKQ